MQKVILLMMERLPNIERESSLNILIQTRRLRQYCHRWQLQIPSLKDECVLFFEQLRSFFGIGMVEAEIGDLVNLKVLAWAHQVLFVPFDQQFSQTSELPPFYKDPSNMEGITLQRVGIQFSPPFCYQGVQVSAISQPDQEGKVACHSLVLRVGDSGFVWCEKEGFDQGVLISK